MSRAEAWSVPRQGEEEIEKISAFPKSDSPSAEEIIDLYGALEMLDGDRELLTEVIDLFLKDSFQKMELFREGIINSDANVIEQTAHSLKGSAGSIMAKRVHEISNRLEVMGKEGRIAEAEEALMNLERELERLQKMLTNLLK